MKILLANIQNFISLHHYFRTYTTMPINNWNWYRAVGTGGDHKGWLGDNPQVEDGRDGGNIGFEDGDRGQFEDECQHMMTKLKLNYYRAEDEMLIMERIQWRKQEEERRKERKRVEKELAALRLTKNKEWREKREEERKRQIQTVKEEDESILGTDNDVEEALRNELKCPVCGEWMLPPNPIYQCEDGHVLCSRCSILPGREECHTCMGPIVGRNTLVESVAAVVFAKDVDTWEEGQEDA